MKFCQPSCEVMGGTGTARWSAPHDFKGLELTCVLEAVILGWPLRSISVPSTFAHRQTVLFHCKCFISQKTSKITVLELELLWQQVIRGFFFPVFVSILRI